MVPSTPIFKPSCRSPSPRSSSGMKCLVSAAKVSGCSFFEKK
jgi:hypothetical protein